MVEVFLGLFESLLFVVEPVEGLPAIAFHASSIVGEPIEVISNGPEGFGELCLLGEEGPELVVGEGAAGNFGGV